MVTDKKCMSSVTSCSSQTDSVTRYKTVPAPAGTVTEAGN